MVLKSLLVATLICISTLASAFDIPGRNRLDEVKHPMKFICAQDTGSHWYLKIDISKGKIESYEQGEKGTVKTLIYQAFEKVDGNVVYEFSDQVEKTDATTQIIYFNYDKKQASVAKVSLDPQSETKIYEFFCSIDNRHLLIVE